MDFYGWLYNDEGHAAYGAGTSPYARPVSIDHHDGSGYVPYGREEEALAVLNAKRLPWELHDGSLYRPQLLGGGWTFPAGTYRVKLANNIRAAQGMPVGLDYPWPLVTWLYALERRSHDHGILTEAPFVWYPYSVYNSPHTLHRSYVANLWMAEAPNFESWETHHNEHGPSVLFTLKGATCIAAIVARMVWVWTDASVPSYHDFIVAQAAVNGFTFRAGAERDYVMFATDGPH